MANLQFVERNRSIELSPTWDQLPGTTYDKSIIHKQTSYTGNYRMDFVSWASYSRAPIGTSGPTRSIRTQNPRTTSSSTTRNTYNRSYRKPESTTTQLMLDEIVQEVKMGRMNGPFTQPTHWQQKAIALSPYPELRLLSLPHPSPAIALPFSIQQVGSDLNEKIRRGEHWRRSGHNSTCIMHNQPYHHTPDHFASLAIHTYQHDPHQHHDRDGAYRQLPLDQPQQAYTCCSTHQRDPPYGVTTSSSSVPQQAYGVTTDSVAPWSQYPASSSFAPPCATLTTMAAQRLHLTPNPASGRSKTSMEPGDTT